MDYYKEEMGGKKTTIGNDVWIGANAVVRKGVRVGDGAVIGAGAIVLKDVPAFSVVAGVPAKVIRYRFDENTIYRLLKLKWWEMDEDVLKALQFNDVEKCIEILEDARRSRSK